MASMDSTNTSETIKRQTNSNTTNHGSKTNDPFEVDANWIRSNIKMRRCTYFVPMEEGSKICHCGYEMECHTNSHINESNSDKQANLKWEFLKHTETEETNAFGEIEFDGRERDIKPKFVRVDINTEMSVMLEMIEGWGMEIPNLLISVAGDTNIFRKKANLRDGLMKAARKIGAWIITGGAEADVTGPHMTLKENVVIGIAPWGVIHNRTALESKEGLCSAKYDTTETETCDSNERSLNPNHSHYILVDDGTQHKLDIEIPFRLKLEREMVQMKTKRGNDVLIVTLVMGGGQGALKTVDEALKQDTPVVVIKGSGGAADVLAYAFQNASTGDEDDNSNDGQDRHRNEKFMPKSLEDRVGEKMKQKDISCEIKVIKSCLLKSGQIHIFDLDSDDYDINDVLLNALLKAYIDKLKNASANNMIIPLDEIMFNALKYGRADIVKQLIEKEFKLRTFLTAERLLKLYNSVVSKSIFMVIDFKKKEKIRLTDVRRLVQDLVDCNLLNHYMDDNHEKEGQKKTDDARTNASQERHFVEQTNQELNDVQDSQKSGTDCMTMENPCFDLLIWSVLTNQQDNAKLFWRYGKNKLTAALVAHALFSALSRKADDRDLREAIDYNSSEFMTLANKVAIACYKADEKKTYDLLTRMVPQWGNTTCIEIALNAHNEGFISLKVYRNLYDKIWMGGLKPQNSIMMLLLCIAFPPLIIWFARFEKEDQEISSSDTNISDGQEALCCLSSKRRKVCSELKAEANDKFDKAEKSSRSEKDKNSPEASICWKLRTFYKAPIIIFMQNMIFFVAFLFLYSYVLISKLEPHISAAEICLILWVSSFFFGEAVQVFRKPAFSSLLKWKLYASDDWNLFNLVTIVLFIIGMCVLRINPQPLSVEIARVILGIVLVCYFLRILHAFHAHRQVGPKLVMIMSMVSDLGTLAAILGVFILAYAVASYAILYPNTAFTIDTLMKILKRPYWNIYGELVLEEIEGEANCSDNEDLYGNGTVPRCPTKSGQYVVPIMMGIYMMMTNTLLISLLIASFGFSIKTVHQHKDLHCSNHRYKLIYEYYTKTWLPHPFAILINLPESYKQIMCVERTRRRRENLDLFASTGRGNAFFQTFDNDYDDELNFFENVHALMVYQRMEQTRKESIDIIARHTRLETKVKSEINNLTASVEQLKQQQNDMSKQLQTIIELLKELKEHKLETK